MIFALLAFGCSPGSVALQGSSGSNDLADPIDADGDGFPIEADCDDADRAVYPGAPERCDGRDQDCDGIIDEGFDLDGDGWNTGLDAGCAALGPTDCDDGDDSVNPAAVETCDGRDQDCDGVVDPEVDADGDGSPICADCDDTNASVLPGAPERCDGRDNDCNGASDEPFDADGDGTGACLDCDDTEAVAHPGAVEVCDAVDNDCDGDTDEGFDADVDGFAVCRGDCDDGDPLVNPWGDEVCNGSDDDCSGVVDDVADVDLDGYFPCAGLYADCDDLDPGVYPGAPEVCDGADSDCDGLPLPDEGDVDGDGVPACAGDCDDADSTRAAGLPELCDGIDNDCDAGTDEAVDGDGDGFSVCAGDCDDGDALAVPGGTEVCNAADDDCDGRVDNGNVCGACSAAAYGGHVYLFCEQALDWQSAENACLSVGYDLVALGDAAEESWVSDTAASLQATTWWSGYNDRAVEGAWGWSNGEPVVYTNWAAGEPNNSGDEDCTQLLWSGYQWNDAQCAAGQSYVCEAP